jgi:CubicO group peptidase (beta-lactamase class C family)
MALVSRGARAGTALALCSLASATSLGPGSGAWKSEPPEEHGMTTAGLAAAASLVEHMAPLRHCFLVVKDGVLVQESYYGVSKAENKYESDSLAKTATALLMMTAASKGLFDLDTPLAHYGVAPANGSWPPYWWPEVTARHLLTQTGGCVTGGNSGVAGYEQCYSKPGTNWTYDSEMFIEHLSELLHKTTNQSSKEWATKNFAAKLGVPDLYADDGDADLHHPDDLPGFSAGGGQMLTCRDHARFGQLLLNKGLWPLNPPEGGNSTEAAAAEQLITPYYAGEVLRQQIPNVSKSYGLLTWLGGAVEDPGHTKCCAPRWGSKATCRWAATAPHTKH